MKCCWSFDSYFCSVCGNTTPKIAGQLQEVSEQCLFSSYCAALTLHTQARSDPAEARGTESLSAHLLCSYPSSTQQKNDPLLQQPGEAAKASPLHHILSIWPLANLCLFEQMPSALVHLVLCWVFSTHSTFFCLKEQTSFYNLNASLMAKGG